jgi:hypothetical protein
MQSTDLETNKNRRDIELSMPILNIRLLLPFGNGSGILLSMSDKETQSSSGGFGHL